MSVEDGVMTQWFNVTTLGYQKGDTLQCCNVAIIEFLIREKIIIFVALSCSMNIKY